MTWSEIVRLYQLTFPETPARNLPARYNICPATPINTVVEHDGGRELVEMRWGLVPAWWKKRAKEAGATFNAHAETVATKPMFKEAFRRRRCIIPASGYYEWTTTPEGKQPYYFTPRDGSAAFSIAAIWDEWRDVETGEALTSCAMIITAANDFVSIIHDRMPALLTPDQFSPWLSGAAGTEVLRPAPNDMLRKVAVSKRVNSSRAPDDDPALIERLAV